MEAASQASTLPRIDHSCIMEVGLAPWPCPFGFLLFPGGPNTKDLAGDQANSAVTTTMKNPLVAPTRKPGIDI
jgi:hypothetical protein